MRIDRLEQMTPAGPKLVYDANPAPAADWPEGINDDAYIGLPGDFARLVAPHTEADPVALVGTFLVGAGVLFGREAWAEADGRRHYPAEYALLVGETGAAGRKGTAQARTMPVLQAAEPEFSKCVLGGLSSAEGLIKRISQKESEILESGPTHSYLAQIPEFASLLAVIKREGNALSPVLRQGWDGDRLQVMTRKDPLDGGEVNLSVIAHITPVELLGGLTATDRANGFANRFLVMMVKRSQSLPEGGGEVDYSGIVSRLRGAVRAAKGRGIVRRDDNARQLWAEQYEKLTRPREGMVGALCARAEAHALRLSLLYALLDCSSTIRPAHLYAGIAFWEYCERSIAHIFGSASGDPDGDRILSTLASGPCTITDLMRLFSNHRKADTIEAKMAQLARAGKVTQTTKDGDRKSGIPAWGLVRNGSQ